MENEFVLEGAAGRCVFQAEELLLFLLFIAADQSMVEAEELPLFVVVAVF